MTRKNIYIAATFTAVIAALGIGQAALQGGTWAQETVQAIKDTWAKHLVLVFRGQDPGEIWAALQRANYIALLPALLLYFAGVAVRAGLQGGR